jgi:hypothetical protein
LTQIPRAVESRDRQKAEQDRIRRSEHAGAVDDHLVRRLITVNHPAQKRMHPDDAYPRNRNEKGANEKKKGPRR